MNILSDSGAEFELFGYHRFEDPGFALPLYRSCNFLSNAIYVAVAEVGGDLDSKIIDFDVTDIEPQEYLNNPLKKLQGDSWTSIFCVDGHAHVGTSREIIDSVQSVKDNIREKSPLTLFDLSVSARSATTDSEYRNARKYLERHFDENEISSIIEESMLRKYVWISLAHCFLGKNVPISLHPDLDNFGIHVLDKSTVSVVFSSNAQLHLDDAARQEFSSRVTAYFDLIGLEVSFRGGGFPNAEPLEAEEPQDRLPPTTRLRRTRRFGLAREIAIDLGTTNTRLFSQSRGLILSQPSVVALRQIGGRKEIVAVGDDALAMEGRTPDNISIERPLRDGAIAELDIASEMIKHFIKLTGQRPNIFRPLDIVVCVPSGSSPAERRSIANAAKSAGASQVSIILQPLAAAIGAGAPVLEPVGSLILIIGGGTTEVALVAMQGVAYSVSTRTGGDRMTDDVVDYIRRHHNLLIGRATAERIKREFGVASARYASDEVYFRIRGRDLVQGVPSEIEISQASLSEAFADAVSSLVETIKTALENVAPELAGDIVDFGIVMTGGGAKLGSLDRLIRDEVGLPVHMPDDPEASVALGVGMAMADARYEQLFVKTAA